MKFSEIPLKMEYSGMRYHFYKIYGGCFSFAMNLLERNKTSLLDHIYGFIPTRKAGP